jgi:metal-dependent hydrolase (beta-lactamase superfamily II)
VRYISLGSGSKGNATLIEHQDKSLLIDCGFSRKALFERMSKAGADPQAVVLLNEWNGCSTNRCS